ncbi:MAG: endo-1,4-beta-xylanase, partial [Pseudomonadota bacterium]
MTRWPMRRREVLAGCGSASLAACTGAGQRSLVVAEQPASTSGVSLDALAQRQGRRFGTAVAWNEAGTGMSLSNPDYAALVKAECGIIVPENEMKWQALRPSPDSYDFTAMDEIARWAIENDQELRAHVLLWHRPEWFPDWLNTYDFGANPAREAERVLVDHIDTVTTRYRSRISSWDVVNEAIDHDRRAPIETS